MLNCVDDDEGAGMIDEIGRLDRWQSERTLAYARWAAAAFAFLQAWLMTAPDQRPFARTAVLALGGALVLVNIAVEAVLARQRAPVALAVAAFGIDLAVAATAVWLLLVQANDTIWLLLLLVVLEGAYRWALPGAIGTAGAAVVLYAAIRASAAATYDFELTIASVTFVGGILGVQALVVGWLVHHRRDERAAAQRLHSAALTLNAGLKPQVVWEAVVTEAARITAAEYVVAWVVVDGGYRPAATWGLPPAFMETYLPEADPVFGAPTPATALLADRTVWYPDPEAGEDGLPALEATLLPAGWRSVASVPLRLDEKPVGVLSCYYGERTRMSHQSQTRLEALAAVAAVAVANAGAYERERTAVESLRTLDSLKDDFLSTVSHELRTPLTVVEGFATTLVERWAELPEDQRRSLVQRIEKQAQDLHERIRDLLDFSRLQAGSIDIEPVSFDVVAFVRETVNRLAPRLEPRSVNLRTPEEATCFADRKAVELVLENILVNAARYSDPDTTITVRIGEVDADVEVSVSDEGIGVPADEMDQIFERFYRGRADEVRRIRGTGIGLAIVKELTEASGGSVDVESTVGEGSTFTVRLPSSERESGRSVDVPPRMPAEDAKAP